MKAILRPLKKSDWNSASKIYAEGIATGIATFETEVPSWEIWDKKYLQDCRLVAAYNGQIVGFAVLSLVSHRQVYRGVAEVSVYVGENFQRQKVGYQLLDEIVKHSENKGFWTLHASVFTENIASLELHKKCGFRVVGIKERIGKLNGKWHDNYFLERRSSKF